MGEQAVGGLADPANSRNVLAVATDTENAYFPPYASSSTGVIVENCTNLLVHGSDYNNWFGSSEQLVSVTGSTNVSMYAMYLNLGGPNAIGGDRPVPKGDFGHGSGIVADVHV